MADSESDDKIKLVDPHKGKADGLCMACGGPVPPGSPNLYYCQDSCRQDGAEYFSRLRKEEKESEEECC